MFPDGACGILFHPRPPSIAPFYHLPLSLSIYLSLLDGSRSEHPEKAIRWIILCDWESQLKYTMPYPSSLTREPGCGRAGLSLVDTIRISKSIESLKLFSQLVW